MKPFKCFFINLVFFIDLTVFGQKNNDLSNETIIEMYSKGLPTSIIASRINASANTFDISTENLIKFMTNKLPDGLINVIVEAALDSTRHIVIPGSENNFLSNESVIAMYNKGVSPPIISLQITKAVNAFDVSTDALIKLTENKIPEDLITAIIEAAGDRPLQTMLLETLKKMKLWQIQIIQMIICLKQPSIIHRLKCLCTHTLMWNLLRYMYVLKIQSFRF